MIAQSQNLWVCCLGVLFAAIFWAVGGTFNAASAANADPSMVARIIGDFNPEAKAQSDQGKQFLDSLATIETNTLAPTDTSWRASDPRWQSVYAVVRRDLADAMPDILAGQDSGLDAQRRSYEFSVSDHLSKEDADTILTFYQTGEGAKYQDFIVRIDRVAAAGLTAIAHKEPITRRTEPISADQAKLYLRMFLLSRAAECIEDDAEDGNGTAGAEARGVVLGEIAAASINKSLPELAKLAAQYTDDLGSFESFSQSDAAQHLFEAMTLAANQTRRNRAQAQGPILQSIKAHRAAWMALYAKEATPN